MVPVQPVRVRGEPGRGSSSIPKMVIWNAWLCTTIGLHLFATMKYSNSRKSFVVNHATNLLFFALTFNIQIPFVSGDGVWRLLYSDTMQTHTNKYTCRQNINTYANRAICCRELLRPVQIIAFSIHSSAWMRMARVWCTLSSASQHSLCGFQCRVGLAQYHRE